MSDRAKKILIPLPTYGFDPTEVSIPWKILTDAGKIVVFATPDGAIGTPDDIMVTGKGLGIWKPLLRARSDAVDAYHAMKESAAFKKPVKYADVKEADYDALYLPGGHDKRVKEYLESPKLQQTTVDFFKADKPVAAICHGVVVAARSIDPATGKSVIHGYQTTALLKKLERSGYSLTRLWMGDYYLTYPATTVEDEVRAALAGDDDFIEGPPAVFRDTPEKLQRGFTVKDRNYISARWPGDAYSCAIEFDKMIDA